MAQTILFATTVRGLRQELIMRPCQGHLVVHIDSLKRIRILKYLYPIKCVVLAGFGANTHLIHRWSELPCHSSIRPSFAMTRAVLRVKKLTELAIIPTRGSALAAGYDLSSAYDAVIPARGKGLVKTDLAIAVPHGCYARVAPRSGLALKKFIDTGAGVIDEDYRGNVGVVLFNHAEEDFVVSRGDRIAQLIIEKFEYADIDVVDEIDETERGAGGFGSTGVEQTLKRARQEEDVAAGAGSSISGDIVFTALEQLFASGSIDDAKRVLLKQRAFSASERQFALLRTALQEYLSKQDTAKTLEWIDAFLSSTAN